MKRKSRYVSCISLFLALILCFGTFVGCDKSETPPSISQDEEVSTTKDPPVWIPEAELPEYAEFLAEYAEYPKMSKYPSSDRGTSTHNEEYKKWNDDKKTQARYYGSWDGLDEFYLSTVSEFLSGSDGENIVYSPVNVYMALAMLAEMTDGTSRDQILSLLGAKNIEELREDAHAIWNANYSDDGAVTSILANSVWLDTILDPNDITLKTLADKYYASTFSGEMGSDKLDLALRSWLNGQTDGLLEDMTNGIELDVNTLIALASTVYFQAKWENEFKAVNTKASTFHSHSGDVSVDFMHETDIHGKYYYGENFSATKKSLEGSGSMFFILPNENVSVNELLSDSEALEFLSKTTMWEKQRSIKVNLAVPKFDVSSNSDLASGLKDLGVTDCFDGKKASFVPLLDTSVDGETYVSSVEHGVRVAIDEKGVTAVAYTVIPIPGDAGPHPDEIDFTLDRPFIFVITNADGTPMFTGIVNQP